MVAPSSLDHFISDDLTRRPPRSTFTASPPKQLGNQIFWIRTSFNNTIATSSSVIVENNFALSLTTHAPNVSGLVSIFDSYALHSAVITISGPTVTTASTCTVYTAIDYTSVANLGTVAGIESFASCNIAILTQGQNVTRYLEPTLQDTIGGNSTVGAARQWVDSSAPSTLWYGFRFITATTTSSYNLPVTINCIWAFRNSI
jgi:hypothetical protein